jgi:DNA-binding LacI/PurR family transcriptional regulator
MPSSRVRTSLAPNGRVTLNFLAERLGLSPASISLVLNDAPAAEAIPQRTKDRIIAMARELRYRPHSVARSLARQRTFTIGVLIPDVSEGYVAQALGGVEDHLLQTGYLYFLASHRHRHDLIDEYKRLLVDRAVEGIIALDTPFKRPLPLPVVSISGHDKAEGVTNVELDHDHAAALALEHLLSLGHRRIAVIQGPAYTADANIRWRAIRDTARRLKNPIDPRLVTRLTRYDLTPGPGYEAARALLDTDRPFTALFAFNDVAAIGAIQALNDAGHTVPDRVAVIGFDDIPGAAYHRPGLTTVRQPLRSMGEMAARLLLERLDRPRARYAASVTVEPELVVRGTTAPVSNVAVSGRDRAAVGGQRSAVGTEQRSAVSG